MCPSPLPSHSPVAQSERHQGEKRSKKEESIFLKNPLPNKPGSVCTIPPARQGFYFCQGMKKPQCRGGGEPRCLRLPALGWAESRRQLIQQEPPGHCRFNRYFVQHRRFRKGSVSNPGCKQSWEKLCVCVWGWLFKYGVSFPPAPTRLIFTLQEKGTGAVFAGEVPLGPFYPQVLTHFFSGPFHAFRIKFK